MARYRGPKSKIARKFREAIFGPDRAFDKKMYPPGQHGNARRRKKESEYAVQLKEKQKAKYTYGILERQFSNMFEKASSKRGITGEVLLQMCESRLDNTCFRLGLSNSRRGARQLVGHRHVLVNGEICNIPSYQMRPGDVIGVREKSKAMEVVTASLAATTGNTFDWLVWDASTMTGRFLKAPEREAIPENIKEQLIVELYSK
jgi:small subunit ribosomal protein S4